MLGPAGNPRAANLLHVVSFLQGREGLRFQIKAAQMFPRHSPSPIRRAPGRSA
jgi:hypothetical protein